MSFRSLPNVLKDHFRISMYTIFGANWLVLMFWIKYVNMAKTNSFPLILHVFAVFTHTSTLPGSEKQT